MEREFSERLRQVVKLHPEVLNENGQIIVSSAAFMKIRETHPEPTTDAERAELHRDAQAQTILDLWEKIAN